MHRQSKGLTLAATAFFLSGAASLADEVVWLKSLTLTFGATTAATATLVAVFMGGLALGSGICGRFVSRIRRPGLLYAVLESGVGLFALSTPILFAGIELAYVAAYRRLGAGPGALMLIRVLLSAAALLPPTMLMGATFPALARAVEGVAVGVGDGRPGRPSTWLYAINTAGAVAGATLCALVSIRTIGFHATLAAAACVSLLAALLIAASPFGRSSPDEAPLPAPAASVAPRPATGWLVVAVLTGACAMADEVLWTRVLVLYLGSSVYAFALVLSVFLTGLVAGSLLAGALAPKHPRGAIGLAQLALGLSLLLGVCAFPTFRSVLISSATLLHVSGYSGLLVSEGLTTALYLLLPTLLMGWSFAVLLQAASRSSGTAPADVAAIYSANTLGGIAGSLLAGFVAIRLLGSQRALLLTGLVAVGLAFFLRPSAWATRLAVPAFLLLALLPGRDAMILSAGVFADVPRRDLLFFREDVTATVAVKRYPTTPPSLSLELNGVNVAGTTPDLVVVQKLQAHLPLLLCDAPRKVLQIGLGSGGTVYSTTRHGVDSTRIVEISPEVVEAAGRFFQGVNHGILGDPRVRITINDGRNFLLASPESFDAILSDSIHPRYAGNGSLYTEDYYRICAQRLRPGGVVSMWLPMYSLLPENYRSIVHAFQDVFPNVSIWYAHSVENAFTVVLATPRKTIRLSEFARRLAEPAVAEDLGLIGASDPAEVLSYLLLAPDDVRRWVETAPPHTDDLPIVEYESGRTLASEGTWAQTLTDLVAHRSRIEDFVEDARGDDPAAVRVRSRFDEAAPILARQVADVQALARRIP